MPSSTTTLAPYMVCCGVKERRSPRADTVLQRVTHSVLGPAVSAEVIDRHLHVPPFLQLTQGLHHQRKVEGVCGNEHRV